jgi:hypothetical protein
MRPFRTSSQACRKFSTDRCQLPVCHGETLAEVVGERLLTVDILLGARGLGGNDAVPVVWQRDADRVHVAPHQHLFKGMVGRATLVAVLGVHERLAACQVALVQVAHGDNAHVLQFQKFLQVAVVTHPAQTDAGQGKSIARRRGSAPAKRAPRNNQRRRDSRQPGVSNKLTS